MPDSLNRPGSVEPFSRQHKSVFEIYFNNSINYTSQYMYLFGDMMTQKLNHTYWYLMTHIKFNHIYLVQDDTKVLLYLSGTG